MRGNTLEYADEQLALPIALTGRDDIVVGAAEALGAARVALLRVCRPPGQLELIASTGLGEHARAHLRRYSLVTGSLLADAYRDNDVVDCPGSLLGGAADRVHAVAAPLTVDGEQLGVIGFEFDDRLPPAAAAVLGVADAAAHGLYALDRDAEHERAQRLQTVTSFIGQVRPQEEIAGVVLEHALAASGAETGSVVLRDMQGDLLRIVAQRGYGGELRSLDPLPDGLVTPVSEALTRGEPVVVETRGEYAAWYPELYALYARNAPERTVVALPLAAGAAPFGAIGLAFDRARAIDGDERSFLLTLAQLCAQAIDRAARAQMYDRMRGLQTITAELARAVTPADVGRVVITKAVQVLGAATGRIVVVGRDGTLVTVAQADELNAAVERLSAVEKLHEMPLGVAIARNETVVLESLDDLGEEWATAVEVFSGLGMQAAAAVPLPSANGPAGGIGFTWRAPRRLLSEQTAFLHAIAAVCAQALARTQLFEEAERSRAGLRHVLDRLDEAVLVVDRHLVVTYANREATALLGQRARAGGRLPDPWPEIRLAEVVQAQLVSGAQPYEASATVDGDRALQIVASRDDDRAMLVLRDVTRRERQERAEREFVANASHELRTPLAAIAAAVYALQLGAKNSPADGDLLLSGIAGEVERLSLLSDALLQLARAQADPGCLLLEAIDLEPLVAEVALRLQPRPGVRVETDIHPCAARGDRALLIAAVSNLAQNAARHTATGTIEIACRPSGAEVIVVVSDTGDGMSADVRARATERFFRGANHAPDSEGFGLGLALARQIVTTLGGQIAVEARKPSGTRMTITLPAVCTSES